MRNKRKLLSLLLTLAMLFTLLPAPAAYAEGDDSAIVDDAVVETEQPGEAEQPTQPAAPDEPTQPAEEEPEQTEPTETEPTVEESVTEEPAAAEPSAAPAEAEEYAVRDTSDDEFYKILHLDCGRKYFTKDWIIALINEMADAGYNQLQLAFGNDGLRFLLDDMSFTANSTTYSHDAVVSAVEAGNMAQNESGDARWLTEAEMGAIIIYANEKGIEIVPLLNLPGHASAILDIANDAYNASGSNNTLDVANSDAAVAFGYAIFQKYVDYFAEQGCQFFNFGADEYANDASGTFSFSRLNSTQYAKFVVFINQLAAYIESQDMTPRAFNDGLYYNGQSADIDTAIQCCYWSSGWGNYPVAAASTIAGKGHGMINTNGDYYYVLGKEDQFDSGYSYASGFSNRAFMGSTISSPVGSMFCIWCDSPNAESETEVAQKTRLVLRAMAARMDGESIDTINTDVVPGGFKADGSINGAAADQIVVKDETGAELTALTLPANETATLTVGEPATWTSSNESVIALTSADDVQTLALSDGIEATSVTATAVGAGTATITAITATGESATLNVTVTAEGTVEVTLEVNETKEVTIDGFNYADAVDGADLIKGIATADVTGVDAVADSVTYTQVTGSSCPFYNALATSATVTKTAYYYKVDDAYYPVYGWTTTYRTTYHYGYSETDSADNVVTIGSSSDYSGYSRVDNLYTASGTAGHPASTTITFTGVGEGATSVTVGGTTYNITVTAPQKTESMSLALNNTRTLPAGAANVKISGSAVTNSGGTLTAASEGTATVTFDVLNDGGYPTAHYTYNITVTKEDLSQVTPLTIEYWITNGHVNTTGSHSASDTCNVGEITAMDDGIHSVDGVAVVGLVPESGYRGSDTNTTVEYWKAVRLTSGNKQTEDAGVDKTQSGEEFTYIRYWNSMWEFSADGTAWTQIDSTDQLVAYYMQKTDVTDEVTTYVVDWGLKKDNWDGLDYLQNKYVLLDYTVKYESGDETPNTFPTSNSLGFHCDVTDASYRTLGRVMAKETDEYEVYLITVTPSSDNQNTTLSGSTAAANSSYTYNGTEKAAWAATAEDFENSGLEKYTSISGTYGYTEGGVPTVEGLEIYKQHAMKVTFYVRAKVTEDSLTVHYRVQGNTSDFHSYVINVKKGTLFDSGIGLDSQGDVVNGSVTNSLNKTQTVSSDLQTMPSIPAQYRNVKYTCVELVRSSDGKDVYLYYTFDNGVTFVIDFGLTLELKPTDLGKDLQESNITKVTVQGAKNGTAEVSGKNVRYTPNEDFVSAEGGETVTVTYTGRSLGTGEDDTVSYVVTILPASNVLYEENFFTPGTGWAQNGTTPATTQTATKTGEADLYGYDGAYASATGAQSSYKAANLTVGKYTDELTTTFYGNAFDLIGTSGKDTGKVFLVITKIVNGQADGGYIKSIDTRYSGETLYQVPLAHVELGEEDATWSVKILASGLDADTANKHEQGTYVEIDSFRVYRTSDNNNYPTSEQGVTYTNIIDVMGGTVITAFIENSEVMGIVASEYEAAGGPQNEIYLMQNQAIAFTLNGADSVDVSVRAVGAATETYTSNTEMYYNFEAENGVVTITNTSENMIAIGNIKLPEGASVEGYSAANEAVLFASVRMAFASALYDPIHNIDVKSANVLRNKIVTLTITADTDVKTLTVNGKTLRPTNAFAVQRGWSSEYVYVYADTVRRGETKDYTVTATNASGCTATQTVQG